MLFDIILPEPSTLFHVTGVCDSDVTFNPNPKFPKIKDKRKGK